jgi:uncharacterized protein
VKDPREVVKAGDVVKVRVKEVDAPRKRIGLTMRSGAVAPGAPGPRPSGPPSRGGGSASPPARPQADASEGAFAAALKRAQEKR